MSTEQAVQAGGRGAARGDERGRSAMAPTAPLPGIAPPRLAPAPVFDPIGARGTGARGGRRRPRPEAEADVVLVTEGTYPHAHGGVSVWCDQLVTGITDRRFRIVALTAFRHQRPVYDPPDHADDLLTVALWDTRRRRLPHRRRPSSLARFLAALLTAPTDDVAGFIQLLDALARYPVAALARHLSFAELVLALDDQLQEPRWAATEGVRAADIVRVAHLLEHLLRPLSVDPGPAPVYHASSNGLPALVCLLARRRHGGRFLLTEHGIYLRERYLELRRTPMARPAKALLVRFHRLVSAAAYAEAALVAPGSEWNRRWETRLGAPPPRIRTIYNGIDPSEFSGPGGDSADDDGSTSSPASTSSTSAPVFAWLGRIDPIKDLDTLIRAFAVVHRKCPEAQLRLFGRVPAGNEPYREELDQLIDELGLDGAVRFEGAVAKSADAYADARLTVLSSISEGFPYSLIEAMACGLPAVATGVGGVAEAVADTGTVVQPRAPDLLGDAMLELFVDPERCRRLGRLARERVLDLFTLDACLDGYRAVYEELTAGGPPLVPVDADWGGAGRAAGAASTRIPLGPDDQRSLIAALGDEPTAMAATVDADEVAATFESAGITDQVAVERFGIPDVFDLAERVWDGATRPPHPTYPEREGAPVRGRPRQHGAAGGGVAPPRPPLPAAPPGAVTRGIAYVLPAVVVAAAALDGMAQAALLLASSLGWGAGQGGGMLAYTVLHRSGPGRGLTPLRIGLAVSVALCALGGLAVGAATTPVAGAAFALPLLHLIGSSALVMVGRIRLLLGTLAPVSALALVALARPDGAASDLVGPASVATVAVLLGLVALLVRQGTSPPGRTLQWPDWTAALPLVGCGWITAVYALLAVVALRDISGLGHDSRQWLLLALPLWTMVALIELLLVRTRQSLQWLLDRVPTLHAFRRRGLGTAAVGLATAAAVLQVALWTAVGATSVPPGAAVRAASTFFLLALTLIGVVVLTAAARTTTVAVTLGGAVAALGWIAATPGNPYGVADPTVAVVVCGLAATVLCAGAALTLVDPSTHR